MATERTDGELEDGCWKLADGWARMLDAAAAFPNEKAFALAGGRHRMTAAVAEYRALTSFLHGPRWRDSDMKPSDFGVEWPKAVSREDLGALVGVADKLLMHYTWVPGGGGQVSPAVGWLHGQLVEFASRLPDEEWASPMKSASRSFVFPARYDAEGTRIDQSATRTPTI
ncbi:MAG: hypothetical protein ACK5RL_09365 [Acidimicrobiales bacterium]